MPTIRQLSLCITLCLCSIASFAAMESSIATSDEVEQVRHGRHFSTASRKMVVICPNDELKLHFSERLASHGAMVTDDFFSRLFAPRIVVRQVAKIEAQNEAYSIEVGRSKVVINYTSSVMLEQAIRQFYSLFDAPYGQRIIRGANLYHYADQPQRSNVKHNQAGIADGVTSILTTAQVENAIRTQLRTNRHSDFTFAMVNRRVFRFDFNAFKDINSTSSSISENQAKYTTDQIRRFVAVAREAGGEFIPAIDLLSDNDIFTTYTGHAMSSVEGMRFVRAIIEQCARQWGIKSICIGRRDNCTAAQYYIDFLTDIASREGITLVSL